MDNENTWPPSIGCINIKILTIRSCIGMSYLVVDKVGENSALFLHFEYFGLIEQRTVVAEHLLLHTELRLHSPLQRRGFFTYQYTDNIGYRALGCPPI